MWRTTKPVLPWSGALMMTGLIAWGLPFAAPAPEAAIASGPAPAVAPLEIEVDLSERRLRVLRPDGSEVRAYDVAVGRSTNPTPPGSYSVSRIIWNPRWVPPPNREWARGATAKAPGDPNNPMQTAKIYFREPWYYIHGTNAPESTGTAASRGCVRMRPDDVKDLALLLMRETDHSQGEGWVESVLSSGRSEEVHLSQSIPMRIRP